MKLESLTQNRYFANLLGIVAFGFIFAGAVTTAVWLMAERCPSS